MTWEQRWHPLREEWVIVAAHRQNRPWSGETVGSAEQPAPEYDPGCYLCPGNRRVSGEANPPYEGVFVFDNDHPCVGPAAPDPPPAAPGIYRNAPAHGIARVVCYTPRHNVALAELSQPEVLELCRVWQQQYRDLGARPGIRHVLIFENKGAVVGVSNPHPHCQIYANNFVFKYIETEARASRAHWQQTGRALMDDIVATEEADGRRVLCANERAVAFVPYFARYAYEAYVAPRSAAPSIAALSDAALEDFAAALRETLIRYDNLWRMPFPYVLALHNAPTGEEAPGFGFHAELHPPLRRPGLLKYLAGPEIGGGNFLSDTAPEEKAAELRATSATHYRQEEAR
jgi:UDPglucose--hexose-1-phosphate uridylyltransferase